MHNNYHFFKRLIPELKRLLIGKELLSCFSQDKDELILGFADDRSSHFIRAPLKGDFTCLSFPEEFHRSRRNSADIFSDCLGSKVIEIQLAQNERIFILVLENQWKLLFKMHGNRSNIILFHGENFHSMFKNKLENDQNLNPNGVDRVIDQGKSAFLDSSGNFKAMFPTFGPIPKHFLNEQGFDDQNLEKRWTLIQEALKTMESGPLYICFHQGKLVFSLLPVGDIIKEFREPIEAINSFYIQYIQRFQLDKEKTKVYRELERERKKTINYIAKTSGKLTEIQEHNRHEEIANIIMANLHTIPANASKVNLFDFYHNENIDIKLNPNLTPQRFAENLYRKSKNQRLEIENLETNLKIRKKQLVQLELDLKNLEEVSNLKELRKAFNHLAQSGKKTETVTSSVYKKFNYSGFDILVGKNAKANDQLTFKIARKDDLWLHARDVSGSHVVIRQRAGMGFPENVVEVAAALAAFNSKRKNDTLCPVIYTPKKYVRKAKSAPPGAVIVEKERVIIIEPAGTLP